MYETLLSDYIKVEPYWNVNLKLPLLLNLYGCIKVEPYWNANGIISFFRLLLVSIKVEPYWNVNQKIKKKRASRRYN